MTRPLPRPFLKWAGGKGQLLSHLVPRVEEARASGTYYEPFVGGGALFFELARTGRLPPGGAVLADANPNLVDAWLGVRDHVEEVLERLAEHQRRHGREHYYAVRARVPEDLPGRAARVLYLNRTCFNGLYRENRRGEFNVPMGRYRNPAIHNPDLLRACAAALQGVEIRVASFEALADRPQPGDVVYFDPPYVPLSATASFTAYRKGGFGPRDQERLAEVFDRLAARGVAVILSNSLTGTVRRLYAGHRIDVVDARRNVNSRGDRRGPVPEAIVLGGPPWERREEAPAARLAT